MDIFEVSISVEYEIVSVTLVTLIVTLLVAWCFLHNASSVYEASFVTTMLCLVVAVFCLALTRYAGDTESTELYAKNMIQNKAVNDDVKSVSLIGKTVQSGAINIYINLEYIKLCLALVGLLAAVVLIWFSFHSQSRLQQVATFILLGWLVILLFKHKNVDEEEIESSFLSVLRRTKDIYNTIKVSIIIGHIVLTGMLLCLMAIVMLVYVSYQSNSRFQAVCTGTMLLCLTLAVTYIVHKEFTENKEATRNIFPSFRITVTDQCQNSQDTHVYSLLLVGKTGNGKSTTGNTILGKKVFTTSASTMSVTRDVTSAHGCVQGHRVKVVDLPGLGDTSTTTVEGIKDFINLAKMAMAEAPSGYDTILIFIRLGRLTEEDQLIFAQLNAVFGERFTEKYSILIVTFGDNYDPNENQGLPFQEWSKTEEGFFKLVKEKCRNRVLLMDNRTKNPVKKKQQLSDLLNMVKNLTLDQDPYTLNNFHKAQKDYQKMLRDYEREVLSQKIRDAKSEILVEFFHGDSGLEDLLTKTKDLLSEAYNFDKGTGEMKILIQELIVVESKIKVAMEKFS